MTKQNFLFIAFFNPYMKNYFIAPLLLLFFISCTVQSPKYTTLDTVISLQIGMTKAQVEGILGLQPYDIKAFTDSSNTFIYVYRLFNRNTLSFFTNRVNGKKSLGRYVQLDVTYSKDNKVVSIESCRYCPDNLVTKSKIDFGKLLAFVTVTLPVLLIYFGLK